ncbi:MAG TPA: hypothetical protein VL967_07365 [Terracidiphilus sp.]|nr:hypothetical protein [Terracidiphilus sp.]
MAQQGPVSPRHSLEESVAPVQPGPPHAVPSLRSDEITPADDRHGFARGFRYAVLIEVLAALLIAAIWILVEGLK